MRRRSVPMLLLIAVLMQALLVGCGSRSEPNITPPAAVQVRAEHETDTAVSVQPAPAEAPAETAAVNTVTEPQQAHYQAQWWDLPAGAEFVEASCVSGDTLYFSASVLSGEQTYTDEVTGETYAYDTYDSRLYTMDLQSGESAPWQADVSELPEDGWQADTSVCAIRAHEDGSIWLAETRTRWQYEDGAYLDGGWQLQMHRLDADGTCLAEVLLTLPDGEAAENTTPYTVYLDTHGRFYTSDWEKVYVWDADGAFLFSLVNEFYGRLVPYSEDTVGISRYGTDGQYAFVPIDAEKQAWGEVRTLPADADNISMGSGRYDFYYEDGGSIYGYLAEEETAERVLDWMDYDVDSSTLDAYALVPNGTVYAVSHSAAEAKTQFVVLHRTEAGANVQKKLLRLGCIDLSLELRGSIIEFNKTNADYRIEVTDFAQENTSEASAQLEQAIASGEIDLVAADNLPLSRYEKQNLLTDLSVFLDAEDSLRQDVFVPNALQAAKTNGKLLRMPMGFRLSTVAARKSVMQDLPWSYASVLEGMAKLREDASVFCGSVASEDLFEQLCVRVLGTPDAVTAEDLADLLKIAARSPQSAAEAADLSDFSRMLQNRQLLTQVHLQSLEDLYAVCAALQQDICFPAGASFAFEGSVAICAASKEHDAAWSFIRMRLQPDAQRTLWVFPMRADVLAERAQTAMTQTYRLDENGEPILDEAGEPVALARGSVGFSGDEPIEIYALSEEHYAMFTELLQTASHCELTDPEQTGGLKTAAAAFFTGGMSAEATADAILRKITQ